MKIKAYLILGSVFVLLMFMVSCTMPDNNINIVEQQPLEQKQANLGLPGVGPDTIVEIVKQASPAVVKIKTVILEPSENFRNDPFFRQFFGMPRQQPPQIRTGFGSGFIISEAGYVLTNEHVINRASEIYVKVKGYPEALSAKVIGADFDLDLAVLKIDSDKKWPHLKLGSSKDLKVGEWVIAIGSPYGLEGTATVGIISAKERPVTVEDRHFEHLLQTDAAINPGNSGGPLLNLRSEVVGINTAVNVRAQGIGFAIPTNTVKAVLDQLIAAGRVIRPWLGVHIQTITPKIAKHFELEHDTGVLVFEVQKGSPAAKVGILPGDIIISLDNYQITSAEELIDIIQLKQVGDLLKIGVMRAAKEIELTATITERPVGVK